MVLVESHLAEAIERATNGGNPQSLTQLLHWGLQHTDLDELHAKAEGLRAQQGEGSAGVLSAAGNSGEATLPATLPSPDESGQAAVPRSVSMMSKERRVELDGVCLRRLVLFVRWDRSD